MTHRRPSIPADLLRRAAAVLATVALLALAACGDDPSSEPGDEASAQVDRGPAEAAAAWLAAELDDGVMRNEELGVDDYGLSIDTALALAAIGGHEQAVQAVAEAVATQIEAYTTGKAFGTDDVYAGATAKAMLFIQSRGDDPTDVGGADLRAQLEALVAQDGPIAGRVEDDTSGQDYANVLSQAFAVRSLLEAGSEDAGPVLDFLLEQQCADGFFRLELTVDKRAPDQGCDAAAPEVPPVDTTALVVVLLDPVASDHEDLDQALERATDWIESQQEEDGSFVGGTDVVGPNANSTGLGGWALGLRGEDEDAAEAAEWVHELQLTDPAEDCAPQVADEIGAIGYDEAAVSRACRNGIAPGARDQWRRATAQAAPALLWLPASA